MKYNIAIVGPGKGKDTYSMLSNFLLSNFSLTSIDTIVLSRKPHLFSYAGKNFARIYNIETSILEEHVGVDKYIFLDSSPDEIEYEEKNSYILDTSI